jgi:hypothetical protein
MESRTIARDLARAAHLAISLLALHALLVLSAAAHAQSDNHCDQPGEAPDLIDGGITARTRWGSIGGITAFSLGASECNIGDCWLNFFASTSDHPLTGQNMFRLKAGRFEQIGQSWLLHGFFALSQPLCSTGCLITDGTHLGVNCSNTNSASIAGRQVRLGPKFEVNPSTGEFPFPATSMSQTGDTIYKRLQVHNTDLDPALNPGAQYWVEVQFVARDVAAAANLDNNASYRPVTVTGSGGAATVYDAIRTLDPSDFVRAASCLPAPDPSSLTATDPVDPPPGESFKYLVRARNACPVGSGPLGATSSGAPRVARTCP